MIALYYAPGACSMAAHIVMEESGEKYEPKRMDLTKGEQKTPEYMKIHPLGRVPALKLDDGTPLSENTAILPFLGKRFGLWPSDPVKEAQALSLIGFFASSVHPANTHIARPERFTYDKSAFPRPPGNGQEVFPRVPEADRRQACRPRMALRQVLSARSVCLRVLYVGRAPRAPMAELKNYTAFKDRMVKRPAVQRVIADENVKL